MDWSVDPVDQLETLLAGDDDERGAPRHRKVDNGSVIVLAGAREWPGRPFGGGGRDARPHPDVAPADLRVGQRAEHQPEEQGDVAFISSRNRVKLVVSEKYFKRTSPKLSSKLVNLKSVVEIIPSTPRESEPG